MTSYDKRRTFKLYTDGKNYVLASQLIENEKLLIKVNESKVYLNKISDDEWQTINNKSKKFHNIPDSNTYGCLGLLSATGPNKQKDHYLLFVKDAVSVNSIGKCDVLRITDVYIACLNNDTTSSPTSSSLQSNVSNHLAQHSSFNNYYLTNSLNSTSEYSNDNLLTNSSNSYFIEIRRFLSSGYFYFTYSSDLRHKFDLTLTSELRNTNQSSDTRYLWNENLIAPFRRFSVNTDDWLLKIICGCVEIRKVISGSLSYKACIISRLSNERAGTRFNCRGADDYGYVANFVETEQLIVSDTEESSLLQIRGSIPLFWEQTGIQVGTHRIKITRSLESCFPAFERHFMGLFKAYGPIIVLNLLGKKGDEAMLSDTYNKIYGFSVLKDNLNFLNFDYHQELKYNKQSVKDSLWPKVKDLLQLDRYHGTGGVDEVNFHINTRENIVKKRQKKYIRTNCLDCLDRTNSVQSFIGIELLKYQLKSFSMLNEKDFSKFIEVYRQMWIINGDNISKIYAGTGAIQGKSVTQDISRSLSRAIQNNFLDNVKQDAIDTFLHGSSKGTDWAERANILLTTACLKMPSYILKEMISRYKEYTEQIKCRIAVGTWNINGGLDDNIMKQLKLSDWLIDGPLNARQNGIGYLNPECGMDVFGQEIDIFAVGFEEIVDLNASNIVNASDVNSHIWYKKIYEFLRNNGDYMPITYEPLQLVGVSLFVFVNKKHASYIRNVSVARTKTGLGGAAGNKGGVAMRFQYYNSSFCFLCTHFAAHQNQVKQRNDDFKQIYTNTDFPQSRDVASHDYVIWCGDLNYRIDLPNEKVRKLINEGDWDTLVAADQLSIQKRDGNVFNDFNEGPLHFPPTYKYNLNEDTYDRSEKCRTPAWTDRILWRRRRLTKQEEQDKNFNVGKCLYYGRADIRLSDHRPVCALLEVEVNKVISSKLDKVFEHVVTTKGPFQATVIVKALGVNTQLKDDLKRHIIKLICDFNKFGVYREWQNALYITYHAFQKAIETKQKFNNFYILEYDCYLDVQLENENFYELARNELNAIMQKHYSIAANNQQQENKKPAEVEVGNLLGDDIFDENRFIRVPSQIHSNLSISNDMNSLKELPSRANLQEGIHNSQSYSDIDMFDKMDNMALNSDHWQSGKGQPSFHLFDLEHDDFEKAVVNTASSNPPPLQVPPRPPPPPPSSTSASNTLNPPLIEIDSYKSLSPSPPPPELRFDTGSNSTKFVAHFSKSTPSIIKHDIVNLTAPKALINIDEDYDPEETIMPQTQSQPRPPLPQLPQQQQQQQQLINITPTPLPPPIPPLRTKAPAAAFNSDLFVLGSPGTPPPQPPPLPTRNIKTQIPNIPPPRPQAANKQNVDLILLGDPGCSPPPSPPPPM